MADYDYAKQRAHRLGVAQVRQVRQLLLIFRQKTSAYQH